jgi:hypothetical protein
MAQRYRAQHASSLSPLLDFTTLPSFLAGAFAFRLSSKPLVAHFKQLLSALTPAAEKVELHCPQKADPHWRQRCFLTTTVNAPLQSAQCCVTAVGAAPPLHGDSILLHQTIEGVILQIQQKMLCIPRIVFKDVHLVE